MALTGAAVVVVVVVVLVVVVVVVVVVVGPEVVGPEVVGAEVVNPPVVGGAVPDIVLSLDLGHCNCNTGGRGYYWSREGDDDKRTRLDHGFWRCPRWGSRRVGQAPFDDPRRGATWVDCGWGSRPLPRTPTNTTPRPSFAATRNTSH